MCDFDPIPGFHGILIGWPQYSVEWIFIVFPLALAIVGLNKIRSNSERDYSGAELFARSRRILIGLALTVAGACVSMFIVEPSDSARRLWLAATEPSATTECLQSVHAMDNMAVGLVGLIFFLGFMLPFGLGMLLIQAGGRKARRSRSATFT